MLLHFHWLTVWSRLKYCLQRANATKTNRFQAFSEGSFILSCNKNRIETNNIFLREESIVKSQKRQQKNLVVDINLGKVGNRTHAYYLFCLIIVIIIIIIIIIIITIIIIIIIIVIVIINTIINIIISSSRSCSDSSILNILLLLS